MIPTLAIAAHAWGYGPGPFWFFPIFWILVIGLLIFCFKRRRHQGPASAEGVLRERYARGEIDDTEYRQRLEFLRTRK